MSEKVRRRSSLKLPRCTSADGDDADQDTCTMLKRRVSFAGLKVVRNYDETGIHDGHIVQPVVDSSFSMAASPSKSCPNVSNSVSSTARNVTVSVVMTQCEDVLNTTSACIADHDDEDDTFCLIRGDTWTSIAGQSGNNVLKERNANLLDVTQRHSESMVSASMLSSRPASAVGRTMHEDKSMSILTTSTHSNAGGCSGDCEIIVAKEMSIDEISMDVDSSAAEGSYAEVDPSEAVSGEGSNAQSRVDVVAGQPPASSTHVTVNGSSQESNHGFKAPGPPTCQPSNEVFNGDPADDLSPSHNIVDGEHWSHNDSLRVTRSRTKDESLRRNYILTRAGRGTSNISDEDDGTADMILRGAGEKRRAAEKAISGKRGSQQPVGDKPNTQNASRAEPAGEADENVVPIATADSVSPPSITTSTAAGTTDSTGNRGKSSQTSVWSVVSKASSVSSGPDNRGIMDVTPGQLVGDLSSMRDESQMMVDVDKNASTASTPSKPALNVKPRLAKMAAMMTSFPQRFVDRPAPRQRIDPTVKRGIDEMFERTWELVFLKKWEKTVASSRSHVRKTMKKLKRPGIREFLENPEESEDEELRRLCTRALAQVEDDLYKMTLKPVEATMELLAKDIHTHVELSIDMEFLSEDLPRMKRDIDVFNALKERNCYERYERLKELEKKKNSWESRRDEIVRTVKELETKVANGRKFLATEPRLLRDRLALILVRRKAEEQRINQIKTNSKLGLIEPILLSTSTPSCAVYLVWRFRLELWRDDVTGTVWDVKMQNVWQGEAGMPEHCLTHLWRPFVSSFLSEAGLPTLRDTFGSPDLTDLLLQTIALLAQEAKRTWDVVLRTFRKVPFATWDVEGKMIRICALPKLTICCVAFDSITSHAPQLELLIPEQHELMSISPTVLQEEFKSVQCLEDVPDFGKRVRARFFDLLNF